MDFGLSEAQQEIQGLAQQILTDKVTPETLQHFESREQPRFDALLWRALGESGLLGIAVDSDHGGMGFGFSELCTLYECCGRVLAPVPVLQTTIAALALQHSGQSPDVLTSIAAGDCIVTIAPQSNVARRPGGDNLVVDGNRLSGRLRFVPYFEQADRVLLVAADTNGDPLLVMADTKDASISATALVASSYEPQHDLKFDAAVVTTVGDASTVQSLFDHHTVAVCAFQLGALDRMVELTANYTAEREQFGVKISTFQAVAHRAADCYIDTTCLRLVTQQAASRLAAGLDAAEHIHSAKAWCGDAGHRVSYATQHLHGGMGVDRSYPLWRYALWAKQSELVLGNTGDHLRALGERIADGAFEIDL